MKLRTILMCIMLTLLAVPAFAVGTISGTVTDAFSQPVPGISVQLYNPVTKNTVNRGDVTNASGTYSIASVNAGNYKAIFFGNNASSAPYVQQWNGGAASFAAAPTITVANNVTTSGVNAVMGALAQPSRIDLGSFSNAAAGTVVPIPVTLTTGGAAIASPALNISFDPAKIVNVTSYDPSDPFQTPALGAAAIAAGKTISDNPTPGAYTIGILSTSNTNVVGDGTLVTLYFEIASDATGPIVLTSVPSAADPKPIPESVPVTGTSGTITFAPTAPGAPTIGSASASSNQASVSFIAPASDGGSLITRYTVTSNTGISATGPASPITVAGLANGTAYTFTVTATNPVGTGLASNPSNSVTPIGNQAITFGTAPSLNYGSTATVSATGGASGNPVTFSSTTQSICTVGGANGSTVTPVAPGTCTIAANQNGNVSFNPAPQVLQNINIGKANQTAVTVAAPVNATYSQVGLTAVASGGNGTGLYSYSAGSSTACTVDAPSGAITITSGAGTCAITATRAADANYNASSTSAASTVTVGKANQATVTATAPASAIYGQTGLTVSSSGGTGTGAYNYSVGSSTACTVDALGAITITSGTGTCSITATRVADLNYNASSPSAAAAVTIGRASQTAVTTTAPANATYGQTGAAIASGGDGTGAYGYSAGSSTACSVNATTGAITITSGTGTCSITATRAADSNYNVSVASAPATVIVSKATPTVSPWPSASVIGYGQTLADSILSSGAASTTGTFTFNSPTTAPSAGSALQGVTFTPSNTTNYNAVTSTVSVPVSKATPVITWATPTAVFVGTQLSAMQLNASSVVAGSFVYSPVSGTVMSTLGDQTLSATFTPSDTNNYNTNTASVTLAVSSKLVPAITWAAPAAITYGTALSATQLNAGASVSGSFSYSPAAGAILNAGSNQTVTATFTPTDTVTYGTASASVNITVNKATAAIVLDLPTLNQTYSGTAKTVTATTTPPGLATSITYDSSSTAPTAAGVYPVVATITDANYTGFVPGTLTIAQAVQTVTFAATASKSYGNADFGPGASASTGFPITYGSDTPAVATITAEGLVHIVGAGTAIITASQTGDVNYLPATAQQTLTVDKALLTVRAVNASRPFNTENPTLSVTYEGFVNGQDALVLSGGAPAISTTAIIGSSFGSYPITVSLGSLASDNYSFSFAPGTLAVGLASQTISFAALPAKTYGDSSFNVSATPGASGDPVTFTSSDQGVATVTPSGAVIIVGAGSTIITARTEESTNYALATATQTLTVNKAVVTVTAQNAGRVYGAANPVFTVIYSGFVNDESTAKLSGAPALATTATIGSPVGSYPITASLGDLSAANYSFNFVGSTLAVGLASQTISFDALPAKTYGDPAFSLSASGGGSNNAVTFTSDNVAVATVDGSNVTIIGAGSANITASQAGDSNFAPATAQQTLTINKAPLTVTAQASRAYGVANPLFAPVYSGFVNNDTAAVPALAGAPVFTCSADLASSTGGYPIVTSLGNLFSNNYSFTLANGTLTVTPAGQAIDFALPTAANYLDLPITLSATASSGLPVTYSVGGPGSINNNTLVISGAGTINVQVSQAGDANYNPAQVTKSIVISKGDQIITALAFNPTTLVAGGSTTVGASASSGLGISFTTLTSTICTVSGTNVIAHAAGTCTIAADQSGSGNFNPAPRVTKDIAVAFTSPGAPTSVSAVPGTGKATVSFSAPAFNGGGPITSYTVTSNTGITVTDAASPIVVTGLANGTPCYFTVTASNGTFSSSASADSNSVVPNILIATAGAPSASIAKSDATVTYLVTYTNAEAIILAPGDVTLDKTGDATGTVTVSGSGNAERTVSISNLAGNGTLGISIAAGTATSGGGAISATPSEPSATFIVDTTLPTLTVTTLADNTVTRDNTLNVSGSVSDSNQVATLTVNGDNVTVTDGQFNTAVALQDGANTITVNATDGAGNPKSDTRTVIHDITAPLITFSAQTPAVNSITAQEAVTISGSLNKPGSVQVGLHGGTAVAATMDGNNFTARLTLAPGPNTVEVTATDIAYPVPNVSTVQRSVTFDNTKPALAIVDPAQDITTTLGSYPVKVTAADQYTAITLGFSVDGVAVNPAPVLTDGSLQQSVSFTAGKTYAVSVTATDAAGNISTVQRNIVYRPLALADALRALQITAGIVDKTEQDSVLDVAPLLDGKPSPDGQIDISDAAIILRKTVGLVTW